MSRPDTIVAIATAPGDAAIAVTRLSGPDALSIAARFFRGARSPLTSEGHRILFGRFVVSDWAAADDLSAPAADETLDTVLLSVFRAPHSYTGEDVAEISSHGGGAVPRAIFEALTAAGARPARPGEFTERAFRNGRLDLAQAEAVASVVRARSDAALRAAHATLGGELSRRVALLDSELIAALAEVESRIDFPVDVREAADTAELAARCDAIAAPVRDWLSRLPSARRREEGLRVAIVGAPNVGKSSLLNALVGYDRAIVSETPGTTRDTVEASIWLEGTELVLADTAGVRETSDTVERLGVERAARAAGAADITLMVRDASRPSGSGPADVAVVPGGDVIEVWNKADLAAGRPVASGAVATRCVSTVAIRSGGVDGLIEALRVAVRAAVAPGASRSELPATSLRQETALREAADALARAATGLRASEAAYDLVAVDLTDARRALGEVVGRGVDDAVVASIFARFCIGK